MYVRKITLAVLLLLPFAVFAQSEELSEAEKEQLQEEMAEARVQMAEAARRMAEIQRQLLDEQSELKKVQREFLLIRDGELESFEAEFNSVEGQMEAVEGQLENIKNEIHIESKVITDLLDDYSDVRVFGIGDLENMPPRLGVVLGEDEGALTVLGLTPGGGAEKAGIQRGDVLVAVNGQPVADEAGSVGDLLSGLTAGDTVSVEMIRDDEAMTFDVVTTSFMRNFNVLVDDIDINVPGMGERREVIIMNSEGEPIEIPGFPAAASAAPAVSFSAPAVSFFPAAPILGRETELISNHAGLATYFGTDEGVIVLRIDEENPLNLRSGDVILTINQENLSRPVELGRLLSLSGKAGDPVTLEVMRNNVLTQLQGSIPEPMAQSLLGERLHIRTAPPNVEFLPEPEHPHNNHY